LPSRSHVALHGGDGVLIVIVGVKGGIERASLLMMPLLFLLLAALALWAATLENAGTGVPGVPEAAVRGSP